MAEKSCLDAALAFLARREHSVKELKTKLMRKNYAPAEVARVVEKLIENKMLSDVRYAEARARHRANLSAWGPVRIRQELLAAGVSADVAERALSGLSDVGIEVKNVADRALKRARVSLSGAPKAEKAVADPALGGREAFLARRKLYDKLLGKLLRKGFSLEEAKAAIEREAEASD